jgi:hypothetical protein
VNLSRKKSSKEKSSNHWLALLLKKTASLLAFYGQFCNPPKEIPSSDTSSFYPSLCHVPPGWKRAIIHPIPKPKSPELRPISLLNQVGKLCERILTWFLQAEATVRSNRLGCRAGVSAIDAGRLAYHLSAVSAANKRPFAGIFLDITKAHERVHTGILFQKLSAYPLSSHGCYDGSTACSETAPLPRVSKAVQALSARPAMGYHKACLSVSCSLSFSSTTSL